MKRFAQRHMYLGIDAIAARDLGFAVAKKVGAATASSTSSASLGRTETQQALLPPTAMPSTGASGMTAGQKRSSSLEGYSRKRNEARGRGGSKRMREMSPIRPERGRDRDRDRERDWERDKDKDGTGRRGDGGPSRPPRRRPSPGLDWDRNDREKEDEKRGPTLPGVISSFIGELPVASCFDGMS